jgi:hypothetical protein
MTLTPLSEPWILDEVVNAASVDPEYFFVQGTIFDNIGYGITREKVDSFAKMLDENEKAVRLYGKFLVLQGLIYRDYRDHHFNPDGDSLDTCGGHLVKPFTIPPEWPRWCGIDPHDRTPTQITWGAMSPNNEMFFYDEMVAGEQTVKEIAEAILEREKIQDTAPEKIIRIIDPASAQKSNRIEVGNNIRDEFAKHRIYTYPAMNDITAGHKAVRKFLKFEEGLRGFRPRMFVFDTLATTRRSFMRYIYQEHKGPSKQEKELKEKPRDKDKHPMDTIRYVLVSNPAFYEIKHGKRRPYVPDNKRTGY